MSKVKKVFFFFWNCLKSPGVSSDSSQSGLDFIDDDQASDVADITANWSKRNINIDRIEIE